MNGCKWFSESPGGTKLVGLMLDQARFREGEKEDPDILDIGCGRGETMRWLAERFPASSIVGVDSDPALAGDRVITASAEALPFADDSMDIIVMECVLSLAEDPEKVLREVYRVLRPTGRLLMSDIYLRGAEEDAGGGKSLPKCYASLRIRRCLTTAGFTIWELDDRTRELAEWAAGCMLDGENLPEGIHAENIGYFTCVAALSDIWHTIRYAAQYGEYYKSHWIGLRADKIATGDWNCFHRIPFTTQDQIREAPESFVCVPQKDIARIITIQSTGTSGPPKRLYFTHDDLMRTADFFARGMKPMIGPGERAVVYMDGPSLYSVGGLMKEALGRSGIETTVFGFIRDTGEAAQAAAGAACLIGLPIQMYMLSLDHPELRPRSVLLSGDYVPDSVRDFLEERWKCRTFVHWGMTETGYGAAVECGERDSLHLRSEDVFVEIIDPFSGRVLHLGECGEIVVTTLHRDGMPLIRYRTGDLGMLTDEQCSCGCLKVRLKKVRGRLWDAVALNSSLLSKTHGRALTIHLLDELLLGRDEIRDFRAFWDEKNSILTVRILPSAGADEEALKGKVGQELRNYFRNAIFVEITAVRELPPDKGKRMIITPDMAEDIGKGEEIHEDRSDL